MINDKKSKKKRNFSTATCYLWYPCTSADRSVQKTWNFYGRKTQKERKIRCRYNWTMSKNKERFQFAGKKKTPDFLPNGFAGTVFGQGLPPVKVKKKKNRQNWQRQKNDFLIGARILVLSRSIFFIKTPKICLRTPKEALNKRCLPLRGATGNPIWDICRQIQKIPFAQMGPKNAFLVNKVVDSGKTSAGQSS